MPVFHRTALAQDIASKLVRPPATSASGSGLFLAAPRRTGKSTFLREDLRPALEAMGVLVVYADLWENKAADPGAVAPAWSLRRPRKAHLSGPSPGWAA